MNIEPRAEEFDEKVRSHLQFYVYRLIDPRYGTTFYVGKGTGNRVFEHARGKITDDPSALLSPKRATINEIKAEGRSVEHVIHRHGLTAEVAFEIEAALIDAYSKDLTNVVGGHGSGERGSMSAREIIIAYGLPELENDPGDKLVLISIPKLKDRAEPEIYRLVRYCWRINKTRAEKADYVLAVVRGVIVGAFVADEWLAATPENFPELEYADGSEAHRWGFKGRVAPPEVVARYVGTDGKRIVQPELRHDQNPIRYWKC